MTWRAWRIALDRLLMASDSSFEELANRSEHTLADIQACWARGEEPIEIYRRWRRLCRSTG